MVDGCDLGELLTPLLNERAVRSLAAEIVSSSEMNQHFALGIIGQDFDVVGVGEVDFAEILRIVGPARIELADDVGVGLHAGSAGGKRLASVHPKNYGEGIFSFWRQF